MKLALVKTMPMRGQDPDVMGLFDIEVRGRRSEYPEYEIICAGACVGEWKPELKAMMDTGKQQLSAVLYSDTYELVKRFVERDLNGEATCWAMITPGKQVMGLLLSAQNIEGGLPSFTEPVATLRGKVIGSRPLGGRTVALEMLNGDILKQTLIVGGKFHKFDIIPTDDITDEMLLVQAYSLVLKKE